MVFTCSIRTTPTHTHTCALDLVIIPQSNTPVPAFTATCALVKAKVSVCVCVSIGSNCLFSRSLVGLRYQTDMCWGWRGWRQGWREEGRRAKISSRLPCLPGVCLEMLAFHGSLSNLTGLRWNASLWTHQPGRHTHTLFIQPVWLLARWSSTLASTLSCPGWSSPGWDEASETVPVACSLWVGDAG